MSREHLQPESSSTKFERAVSETLDFLPALGPGVAAVRGFKFDRPLIGSIAPWYIAELGLGPISRFFGSAADTIDTGVPWQRIRGTPAAIEESLTWIAYEATEVLDQFEGRRKWNRYQIDMGELPPAGEVAALMDAEYLAGLSDAARSVFFRGFYGYDYRALEWGELAWGDAIWGDDSGVRLPDGTVKWSHGQSRSLEYVGDDSDRQALDIDVSEGDQLGWGDFPWNAPGVTWNGVEDVAAFKSFLLRRLPVYIGFYKSNGDAIGYRRVYRITDVTDEQNPLGDEIFVEFECRTDFGDGAGQTAAHCALVFRCRPSNVLKPGKLWLAPNEISYEPGYSAADMKIGPISLALTFRKTVRERVVITLEI